MELEKLKCPQCGNEHLKEFDISFGIGVTGNVGFGTRSVVCIVFKCSKCGLDFILGSSSTFGTRDISNAPKEIMFTHTYTPAEYSEDRYILYPDTLEIDVVVVNRSNEIISTTTKSIISNDGTWEFISKKAYDSFKYIGALDKNVEGVKDENKSINAGA